MHLFLILIKILMRFSGITKILALLVFAVSVTGFVLYRGGYFSPPQRAMKHSPGVAADAQMLGVKRKPMFYSSKSVRVLENDAIDTFLKERFYK